MSLLDRITARTIDRPTEHRYAIDQYINEYLLPTTFGFNGVQYGAGFGLNQTLAGNRATEITATLPGYLAALRSCPPAFAAQLVRALVLSQARFVFRNPPWHPSTPRKTFGTRALNLLERPWKNATTGELIARMEWHAGCAGNAFVTRRPDRLRVLRPDWVALLYGSQLEPDDPGHALDGELLGYVYQNQGLFNSQYKPQTILPGDMAHWSPLPDPENAGIGMSWVTPAVREIQKDRLATTHTIRYFENGATPNLVVKGITAATRDQFEEIVDAMEEKHAGVANAYRTLYLAAGADATPVGANLADLDMKSVNGASETRIASLSRVHPVILGIAEGLAGSSLNAGNFGMARRIWADSWIYPTLQDLAASLAPLVDVPADAELWTDVGDMPILREDAKDAAEINQIKMATIVSGVNGGFEPESVKAFADSGDARLLKHTGMVSVQLQLPGAEQPPAPGAGGAGPKASAADGSEDDGPLDETSAALLEAMNALSPQDQTRAMWDAAKHPRNPKGSPGGGKFKSLAQRIGESLKTHLDGKGQGDPFDGFDRLQLRKVAKARGIELSRGESRESIAKKLWDSLKAGHTTDKTAEPAKTVEKVVKKAAPKPSAVLAGRKALDAAPIKLGRTDFERGVDGDLLQEIDPDALQMYRGEYYGFINDDLRDGIVDGSSYEWTIHTIDAAMSNSKLTSDVVVHRGVADLSLFKGVDTKGSLVGMEYVEDAYSSTTADKVVTEEFHRPKGAVLNLRVPAGVGAIQLSDFGPPPARGKQRPVTDEAELLLQRGLRFRIIGDRIVNGVRELDAEVVPA